MKRYWQAAGVTLALLALVGCGDNAAAPTPEPGPTPIEIEGLWKYLGPSDAPHMLNITRASMVYTDVDGKWSSTWALKAYDNALHHFQVTFQAGTGSYLPVGQSMSGAYEVSGSFLTTQLANGDSYPALQFPGSCTDGAGAGTAVPGCRLYVKQ